MVRHIGVEPITPFTGPNKRAAFDNQREAINNLNKNITVILIAHRLSTVKICDKIFLLEKGELKNQGTFKELIKIDENYSINTKN